MCKAKKDSFFYKFGDFHAGRFLQETLELSGHDIEWLACHTDSDVEALEVLFTKPNMDAERFVAIGRPMGAMFFDRLHEVMFSSAPKEK